MKPLKSSGELLKILYICLFILLEQLVYKCFNILRGDLNSCSNSASGCVMVSKLH